MPPPKSPRDASHTDGGKLAELPEPHRRLFDDKRLRREVRVSVTRFEIGTHYWVTMREEDNPIWNEEKQTWQSCWDDLDAKGQYLTEECATPEMADACVKRLVKKHFPPITHVILHQHSTQKWKSYRDGD